MKKKVINISLKILVIFICSLIMVSPSASANSNPPDPYKLKYSPLKFSLPVAQRIVLENGIILYILEDNELPLIKINALIRTGTMYDPLGKEGLAELTSYVMKTGGTKKLASDKIDNEFDFLAASPSINVSLDSAQIDVSFLSKDTDKILDLLSQILVTPAFEQEKFNLAKGLKIEELRRLKDDPQRLAFREFNRLIYRNNPRGSLASQKSLKNIERDDLIKFHKHFFQPQNIMIAITGNISKQEAIKKINQYLAAWSSTENIDQIPAPPAMTNPGIYFIDKEISQSTIISGRYAPSKLDPDFYSFTLADFIVGSGGFPSRIFSAVRNNEGLAYSAGSFYRARPDYGIFATYAFTKTQSTLKTISLINSVLGTVRSKSFTDEEINWAKKSINNGFIFSFVSSQQIAFQQMKMDYDHLPSDYLSAYRNKIENVTLSQLNNVVIKYLDYQNNVVLILGDFKKFGEALTTLSNKPIQITPED
jgi:predicted Zn-dependent peptidase